MKTKETNISIILRNLAVIPVLAIIVSCSQEAIQPQSESAVEKSAQIMPEDLPVEGLTGAITLEGIEYYFKVVDGKNTYYDKNGSEVVIDEDGSKIDSIRMFPRKGQVIAAKTGTLKYIEENQENLKYYIGGIEVTQSEAEQTIKNSGEEGVEITKDAAGDPAIQITMTAAKRAKMPQFGSMTTKEGSILTITPTLIDANKNQNNPLYRMKRQVITVAELQEKPADFYIDNEKVTLKEVHYLLHDNPKAGISLKKKTDGSKALYITSSDMVQSEDDLQVIYSDLFETYKKKVQ
ncbi:hypothetical protein [Nonlabens antarcticus]|uniref:hypothetical protein n=1 Tax=Nonlabens antarcticus TaxID=392714 RepID=UPI0018916127|nr:hypothetical protein [Nonlabens antarcticus]